MTPLGYLLIGFALGLIVGCVVTSLNARSDSRRRRGELSRRSLRRDRGAPAPVDDP